VSQDVERHQEDPMSARRAALVSAIEQSFQKRFPTTSQRGRRPVPLRVLFALELLKHEKSPGPKLQKCLPR